MIDRRQLLGAALALGMPVPAGADEAPAFRIVEATPATIDLRAPMASPAFGFDGHVPGPILSVPKGEELRVRLVNRLDRPTSLHWIGLRGPSAMDGAAPLTQAAIAPGGSFDYRFTPPDAGTFGYRAAGPDGVAQVSGGLAGLLIVREPEPPVVDRDWPIVLQDWALGSVVTINGQRSAEAIELPPGSRLRLRLFNASAARLMTVAVEGARPFVLAVDGQPCDLFEPLRQTVPIGPGDRFDLMVDLPSEAGATMRLVLRARESSGDRVLATATTKGDRRPPLPPIAALPINKALPAVIRLEAAARMDFTLGGGGKTDWTLTGKGGLAPKPAFSVARGRPVSLGFLNKTERIYALHPHGHVVRLLHNLDDGWEPYWRDTVLVAPGKTARIAFVADNPGRWLIEGTRIDDATAGLAMWFEVT